MSDSLIKVEGLYKKFCTSLKHSLYYGTTDALRDMSGFPSKTADLRKHEFWALQDINFELKRGETLGLIGQNGCGKTTLLRLINGIFPPDRGKITIHGRIGALIAVGAGFHPHMTGQENIFLNGTILGMHSSEIKRKLDEIIDFAEIGDFIDAPVATYSSGMTVRLGFAIAIHVNPDILLLDEILAVGDVGFQLKCINKVYDLRNNYGIASIVVTHNLTQIQQLSNKILLLNKGVGEVYSEIPSGISAYYKLTDNSVNNNNQRFEAKVLSAQTLTLSNIPQNEFKIGDSLIIKITLKNSDKFENSIFRLAISTINSREYLAFISSQTSSNKTYNLEEGIHSIYFELANINLLPDKYSCHFSIINDKGVYLIGIYDIVSFNTVNSENRPITGDHYSGKIWINHKFDIQYEEPTTNEPN